MRPLTHLEPAEFDVGAGDRMDHRVDDDYVARLCRSLVAEVLRRYRGCKNEDDADSVHRAPRSPHSPQR